ncbi:hypothetical protein GIX45_28045 [Erwinia sp. CPCC 100877]|nr:hypothetical protein [Erwinia sp. CPCC 100877]
MKKILKDEQGVTLVELIATLAVFLVVLFFFGMIMSSLSKGYAMQKQQVEFQQMANDMVANMTKIVNKKGIYEKAGYLGKFKTDSLAGKSSWQAEQVIVVFDPERSDLKTFDWTEAGKNKISITDVLDAEKVNGRIYQLPKQDYKIKIFQQKNKNETLKTQFEAPNYRDTFTIQSSVTILFYKGDIDFNKYVEIGGESINLSGTDGIENKEAEKILYIRKAELTYRDEKKAKGEIPGEGRW